jgi:L-lactate dehydrogenase complex protein LldG
MSARDDILHNIRRALGVDGREAPRRREVADRLAVHPKGVSLALAQREGEARLDLLRDKVLASAASFARVRNAHDVPAEIARWLRAANLPATLRRGADKRLAALDFHGTSIELSEGPSAGRDLNGLSHAFAAIAETGTLALTSGPDNPTTLNFLPDNHIVIVEAKDVLGDMEAVWARLRATYGEGRLPRVVNLVTGPSRSADIEQTLLLGAHGPRALHVIVIG